jgi:hypothetical protein
MKTKRALCLFLSIYFGFIVNAQNPAWILTANYIPDMYLSQTVNPLPYLSTVSKSASNMQLDANGNILF